MKKKERNNWIFIIMAIISILSFSCGCLVGQTSIPVQSEYINEEAISSNLIDIKETQNTKEEEQTKEELLYTTTNVNVRIEPSDSSAIVTIAETNTPVIRTELIDDWAKIKWEDNNFYYIYNEYLSTTQTLITEISTRSEVAREMTESKAEYQNYAYSLFAQYGWTEYDLECLINLWNRESNWNPDAHNSDSGAHGIPQALPASKMASAGEDYYTNGFTQIRWGLDYIANRYSSPAIAWDHFISNNWY